MAKVIARVKSVRVLAKRNGVSLPDNKKGIILLLESPVNVGGKMLEVVSFNKGLLDSIAESNFVSATVAGMSLIGATVSCDANWHNKGDVVMGKDGKPVIENGLPRTYSVEGFRCENIELDLNLGRAANNSTLIESMDKVSAYKASLVIPSAPVTAPVAEAAPATEADKLLTELGLEETAPVDPVEAPLAEVAEPL